MSDRHTSRITSQGSTQSACLMNLRHPPALSHPNKMCTTSTIVGGRLYASATINRVLSTCNYWVGRGHLVSYRS